MGTPIYRGYTTFRQGMEDVTGNYGGVNPLWGWTLEYTGSRIKLSGGNLILDLVPSGMYDIAPHGDITGLPTLNSYANRLFASTGPLTPKVNLPLFIFELKDIPQMLRHAGDLLHKIGRRSGRLSPHKEAAAATLAYQFGWKPLIADIMKMLDFADAMKRRNNELKQAHSVDGLRRRVNLDQTTWGYNGNPYIWSTYGLLLTQRYSASVAAKTWGVVHWKVKDPTQIGKDPSFSEVFRNAMGLNPGMIPINVWKALPWSWCVDWFLDISNILQKNYNMIYYRPYRACIMRECNVVRNFEYAQIGSNPSNYIESGTIRLNRKERMAIINPNQLPRLRLPYLDNFKLSIIGSLAILRLSR